MDRQVRYRWVGVNQAGQTVRGYIEAKNITFAKIALHQQGINARQIKSVQSVVKYLKYMRIKRADIAHLTRRLATLLKAQIPLVQALELLKAGEENLRLKDILSIIQSDVQSGVPLAEAFKKHPQYFNALFCHLIKAGETASALVMLLEQLASYLESREQMKQQLRKSLSYPITIFVIACIVTLGLLIFVVPQFKTLFESFQTELPHATMGLLTCSTWVQHWGLCVAVLIVSICYMMKFFYKHLSTVTFYMDYFSLKIPCIGPIFKQIMVTRFIQTLYIILSSGLSLVEALQLSAHVTHNTYMTQGILTAYTSLKEGRTFKYALENTELFSNQLIRIVEIGEASGQLLHMLKYLGLQQEETLKHELAILSGLFEPILMAILGIWIGCLVIALYMPIFQLGAIVS